MQIIRNGPDIPERLIQAHEDGKVVFFCGAGVSAAAGLSDFKSLVLKLYGHFNVKPNAIQDSAIQAKSYDKAVDLLDSMPGIGRESVREALVGIFEDELSKQYSLQTHKSLLALAETRDKSTRLVTTNFDRLFEIAIQSENLQINKFVAPLLPIPDARWNGIVYLHGLLPADLSSGDFRHVVMSSGDFGVAYLVERWAARFMSELLRGYSLCFIGYSVSDPVLRYMMDASAYYRQQGDSPPEVFAFVSSSKKEEESVKREWDAKNVTPILYRPRSSRYYLYKTLEEWAKIHRQGVFGKESIVTKYANKLPVASTANDDYVGRVMWALSEPNGLPTKTFAELDPVPPLQWLEIFSKPTYSKANFKQFGISPNFKIDNERKFSLIDRPSPEDCSSWMKLMGVDEGIPPFDKIMENLIEWLMRHLNDSKLIGWISRQRGSMHREFIRRVDSQIADLTRLEIDGNQGKLNDIRKNAPNAIPNSSMRVFWDLLISNRVKQYVSDEFEPQDWMIRVKQNGLTTALKAKLRESLRPLVLTREPFEQDKFFENWKVVLNARDAHGNYGQLSKNPTWKFILPKLLSESTLLLRETLELMEEIDKANEMLDLSYIYQPSISNHSQNNNFQDWTVLILLARDAWLATADTDSLQAIRVATEWMQFPYPTFKRLAFYAATVLDIIPSHEAMNWLLADNNRWLWSSVTKRESIRLLVKIASQLDVANFNKLQAEIRRGPTQEFLDLFSDPEERETFVEREIWLRLEKIAATGIPLEPESDNKLYEIKTRNPKWESADDESDEFSLWFASLEVGTEVIPSRPSRAYLVELLKSGVDGEWNYYCREYFTTALCALCQIASEDNLWLNERWSVALSIWSKEKKNRSRWNRVTRVLESSNDNFLHSIARNLSFWLLEFAKIVNFDDNRFLDLCEKILSANHQVSSGSSYDPLLNTFNHPTGCATLAILIWWENSLSNENQELPSKLKDLLTALCDTNIEKSRNSRIVLATFTVTLFRVDKEWTVNNLLPLFDWQQSESEALGVWRSFLSAPNIYSPLFTEIKQFFLDTADHYAELNPSLYASQYAFLLVEFAIDDSPMFTDRELVEATSKLPIEGLCDSAQALTKLLRGAANRRKEFWEIRVAPYLKSIWPRITPLMTSENSRHFAQLCIVSNDNFPEALDLLQNWLKPLNHSGEYLIYELDKSNICQSHPIEALKFLHLIIDLNNEYPPHKLKSCLKSIESVDSNIRENHKFQVLWAHAILLDACIE